MTEVNTRDFFLGGEMTPEDVTEFRAVFDREATRTRGMPDAERKAEITRIIKDQFEDRYRWIGATLAFLFVLLVDVDKGKLSLRPIKPLCGCGR